MKTVLRHAITLILLMFGALHAAPNTAQPEQLEWVTSIPLPAVTGRIDHMDINPSSEQLYIAALGNNSLEVVDLAQSRRITSIPGFGKPQGLLYVKPLNRLFVTSGDGNRIDILDATTLEPLKRIEGVPDADNLRYDAKTHRVYVGFGEGALHVLDARTGESMGDITLAGHPESFQLEESGQRIFVNVPDAGHIAIVDRATRKTLATLDLQGARENFPMALDERHHRLYVGTRKPAALLVYNTQTNAFIEKIVIGQDVDDIFLDPPTQRIYAICGEGVVSVVQQLNADHHKTLGTLKTAPRARTGFYDAESHRLFVAVPASDRSAAELRIYRTHTR